jgi:hypothetical protein
VLPLQPENTFGLMVGIVGPGGEAAIGIATTSISAVCQTGIQPVISNIDNTSYHDYLLVGSVAPGGTYSIYRDNDFLALSDLVANDGALPSGTLFVGDGTVGANAVADITSYSCTIVPEPATFILLGIGAFTLLAYAWRRRSG